MENKTLGEKIKLLRIRAHMTQLELELLIGASSGSVSKIESNETNPTKETLLKFIEALQVSPKEAALLFDINISYDLAKLVSLSKTLTSDLDLRSIMEKTVNELSSGLDFVLITIFLIKEDKLYSQAYTKSIFTEVINNILPQPVDLIHVSLKNHTDNIVVRSVNEQKILYTNNLFDIGKYAVPKFLVDLSVKLTGFKCAIVMPLIDPQNKSIGAIFFAKNRNESFDNELPILKSFVEYLTTIIINAQKYEELKNELSKLKSTNSQVV